VRILNLNDFWLRRTPLRVKTTRGWGKLFDSTPLSVQIERKRIGVILDEWSGPMPYFAPEEIEGLPQEDEHGAY